MISDLLHQSGWKTYMLCANVPASSFVHMVKQVHADLAVISCAQEEMEQELISIVKRIHSCIHRVRNPLKIFIGGGYVNTHPEIVEKVGADGTALDARSFLSEIDLLFPSKEE
jgi:methanogenic corrinoid protein MtbC1